MKYLIRIDDKAGRTVMGVTDNPYEEVARRVVQGLSTADQAKKVEFYAVQAMGVDKEVLRLALVEERMIHAACQGGSAWINEHVPEADKERVRLEVERRGFGAHAETDEDAESDARAQGG